MMWETWDKRSLAPEQLTDAHLANILRHMFRMNSEAGEFGPYPFHTVAFYQDLARSRGIDPLQVPPEVPWRREDGEWMVLDYKHWEYRVTRSWRIPWADDVGYIDDWVEACGCEVIRRDSDAKGGFLLTISGTLEALNTFRTDIGYDCEDVVWSQDPRPYEPCVTCR